MKPGINLTNLRGVLVLGVAMWACMLSFCMFVVVVPLAQVVAR